MQPYFSTCTYPTDLDKEVSREIFNNDSWEPDVSQVSKIRISSYPQNGNESLWCSIFPTAFIAVLKVCLQMLNANDEDAVLIDIGAYIGTNTIYASNLRANMIVSVEPSLDNMAKV